MKQAINLFVQVLSNPKLAHERVAKEKLYFATIFIFMMAWICDFFIKLTDGVVVKELVNLLYIDLIFVFLLVYGGSKIMGGRGSLKNTFFLILLVNAPTIALFPFRVVNMKFDNVFLSLVINVGSLAWKSVIGIVGICVVQELKLLKSIIVWIAAVIITYFMASFLTSIS